jgi:two-component system NtrC family sensor kinase
MAHFLLQDPRGKHIPDYLASLAVALSEEHDLMSREAELLRNRIEHIKEIIAMQQNYGQVSGVKETIAPEQLLEDALSLYSDALEREQVTVDRRYAKTRPIKVDKHAVLQILLNLINNALHACADNGSRSKEIVLRVFEQGSDGIRMEVTDNGMGILPENMTRIFQHGFTTHKDGHGFGLHSGALAAIQLGGSLIVHSDGPGFGATFALELPYCIGDSV